MHFVAERFWPGVTEHDVAAVMAQLTAACASLSADGVGIRLLGGTFTPVDEALSCRFEGTEHAVRAAHEIAGQHFDRLSAVHEFEGT